MATTKGDNERLAVVETEVKNVKDLVIRMDQKLDGLTASFASKEDVSQLEERLSRLESKNTIKQTLTWVGLVVSVLANVILFYQLFTK